MTRKDYHDQVVSDTGPFSIVPEWVIVSGLSHGAVRLYALIARYADYSTGEAFPSRATLGGKLRVSKDTVDRFIKELVDVGALEVVRRRDGVVWQSNLYIVRRSQRRPQGGSTPAPSGRKPAPRGGRTDAPRGGGMDAALTRTSELEPTEQDLLTSDVSLVFEAWIEATGRATKTTKLDAKRVDLIVGALTQYPLEDVLDAVRGWQKSPWHCGHNDQGKTYNALGTLIGSADRIEQFRDLYRDRSTPNASTSQTLRLLDDLGRWAD